ncbi:MAG: LD-carboxypeptidase [Clostridia bacterium]|nr:LD-carboxypeptidase [Clostridia bacterium]
MNLIKPDKLKQGDKVAVVSLSWGGAGDEVINERYELAKKRLEEDFGLEVVAMPHALKGSEFVEKHPELRAKDWMDAFEDKSIKGIFSAIGGSDTIRLLPYINYEVIGKNPKIFMGYSDTTVNHFMMMKAGVQSYYGPSILMEFAENVAMHDFTFNHTHFALFETGEKEIVHAKAWTSEYLPWHIRENNQKSRTMITDDKGYEVLQGHGKVTGVLIGGCIEVMDWLRGTEIWPEQSAFENSILFLETSEEEPSPESLLYQMRALRAVGVLDVISGLYFAKPYNETHYEAYKKIILKVIQEEMGRNDLPIVYNGNFGHAAPMHPIPYGNQMTMDLDQRMITIEY